MATETRPDPATRLRIAARQAAAGMDAVAKGKADATKLESDARTFNGLVRVLTGLADEVDERDAIIARLLSMHRRIADLEIRSGALLVERGDWHTIASEFQAIAEEALNLPDGKPRPSRRRDDGADRGDRRAR
jgi:hypothetical protein